MAIRSAEVALEQHRSARSGVELGPQDNAFLRGLLGGVRCGVLAIDRDGTLVLLNLHGREILGFDAAPDPGTHFRDALATHPALVRVLSEAFEMATLPNRAELDLGPEDRPAGRIGYTVSHVPGADRDCSGAAVFFKDLTRIERAEEQERLKDRLAALGEMAARLAHEVRNPLASIEVTCGLLRRRLADDPQARELVDKVTAEVRRLNGTVTSSLEFVKPVASRMRRQSMLPLLEEAVLVASRRGGDEAASIRIERDCDLPPFRMDASQLRQVFENLLINATEAAGASGHVVVDVERTAARPSAEEAPVDWVVVRIADDGPGIPEEARERIFHPFFTTKRQGSGVGLSTVKKIVDSHGGLIDVDRSEMGGARFTVRLPMTIDSKS